MLIHKLSFLNPLSLVCEHLSTAGVRQQLKLAFSTGKYQHRDGGKQSSRPMKVNLNVAACLLWVFAAAIKGGKK